MDFHTLNRRQLQALCKKNKIPANKSNVDMADALKALQILMFQVEGLDDIAQQSPEAPRTAPRSSARRKSVRGGRSAAYEEEKTELMETPAARSTRRRAPAASSRLKRGSNVKGESAVQRVYGTRRSARLEAKMARLSLTDGGGKPEVVKIGDFSKELTTEMEESIMSGSVSKSSSEGSSKRIDHDSSKVIQDLNLNELPVDLVVDQEGLSVEKADELDEVSEKSAPWSSSKALLGGSSKCTNDDGSEVATELQEIEGKLKDLAEDYEKGKDNEVSVQQATHKHGSGNSFATDCSSDSYAPYSDVHGHKEESEAEEKALVDGNGEILEKIGTNDIPLISVREDSEGVITLESSQQDHKDGNVGEIVPNDAEASPSMVMVQSLKKTVVHEDFGMNMAEDRHNIQNLNPCLLSEEEPEGKVAGENLSELSREPCINEVTVDNDLDSENSDPGENLSELSREVAIDESDSEKSSSESDALLELDHADQGSIDVLEFVTKERVFTANDLNLSLNVTVEQLSPCLPISEQGSLTKNWVSTEMDAMNPVLETANPNSHGEIMNEGTFLTPAIPVQSPRLQKVRSLIGDEEVYNKDGRVAEAVLNDSEASPDKVMVQNLTETVIHEDPDMNVAEDRDNIQNLNPHLVTEEESGNESESENSITGSDATVELDHADQESIDIFELVITDDEWNITLEQSGLRVPTSKEALMAESLLESRVLTEMDSKNPVLETAHPNPCSKVMNEGTFSTLASDSILAQTRSLHKVKPVIGAEEEAYNKDGNIAETVLNDSEASPDMVMVQNLMETVAHEDSDMNVAEDRYNIQNLNPHLITKESVSESENSATESDATVELGRAGQESIHILELVKTGNEGNITLEQSSHCVPASVEALTTESLLESDVLTETDSKNPVLNLNCEIVNEVPFSTLLADSIHVQTPRLHKVRSVSGSDTNLTPKRSASKTPMSMKRMIPILDENKEYSGTRPSRKTATTILKMTHLLDVNKESFANSGGKSLSKMSNRIQDANTHVPDGNKENILKDGRNIELKNEEIKCVRDLAEDKMLNDKSMRELKKMFKKMHLKTTAKTANAEECVNVDESKLALQPLPENQLAD